jgi:single-stranded-DNA-specific exonuclease
MQSKRWLIQPKLTLQADENLSAFPPILRQLLFNRGYATEASARAFLKAEVNFETDPFQMKNMGTAIERIRSALDHGEAIAIYGD